MSGNIEYVHKNSFRGTVLSKKSMKFWCHITEPRKTTPSREKYTSISRGHGTSGWILTQIFACTSHDPRDEFAWLQRSTRL